MAVSNQTVKTEIVMSLHHRDRHFAWNRFSFANWQAFAPVFLGGLPLEEALDSIDSAADELRQVWYLP